MEDHWSLRTDNTSPNSTNTLGLVLVPEICGGARFTSSPELIFDPLEGVHNIVSMFRGSRLRPSGLSGKPHITLADGILERPIHVHRIEMCGVDAQE